MSRFPVRKILYVFSLVFLFLVCFIFNFLYLYLGLEVGFSSCCLVSLLGLFAGIYLLISTLEIKSLYSGTVLVRVPDQEEEK